MSNREPDLSKMGGNHETEGAGRKGKGKKKGAKMCYVHVPAPHKMCNHYVLQTCTSENIFKK